MNDDAATRSYSIDEALRAQRALREAAGLEPEMFPIQAVIGMMSDEIEALRRLGRTDDDIARVIGTHSGISITAAEIAAYYAPAEARQRSSA